MEIHLELEPFIPKLEKIRNEITDSLKKIIGEKEWNYELMLALEEAIVNVIEHGMKDMKEKPKIILNMKLKENILTLELIDKGTPFDASKQKVIDMDEHFNAYKKRGLGVFLIQNIMDHVDYEYDALTGNKLIMEKKI